MASSREELSYTVTVQSPENAVVSQAFGEMLESTQAAMSTVSLEHRKLQEKTEELSKENASLKAENVRLRQMTVPAQAERPVEIVASSGAGVGAGPPPGFAKRQAGRPPPGLVRPAEPEVARLVRSAEPEAEDQPGQKYRLVRVIKNNNDSPVHGVAMSPSGTGIDQIATASWDATVKLYNLTNDEVVRTLKPSEAGTIGGTIGGLYSVAFAKTAPEILGCTSADHHVYVWNHQTGQLLSKLSGHKNEVNGIDFHTSQQVMCTASDDCTVIIWDFKEGLTLRTLDKHTKAVYGATFLGQEHPYFVATCCFDHKARIFDMRDKQAVALLQTHTDDVIGIDYTSPKMLLATGSDDGIIAIWDTRTWKLQQRINTRDPAGKGGCDVTNEVKRVAFSPDGNLLAAACSSGQVVVYNMVGSEATKLTDLGGHTECVFDVAWGVDPKTKAKTLVSASHDFSCRYWREVL